MNSDRWGTITSRAATTLLIILFFCISSPAPARSSEHLKFFSDSYSQARSKFLTAAHENNGRISSYQNPESGPDGEPLYLDVALFGDPTSQTFLVLSSGTHGVEGFTGSAIQTGLLLNGLAQSLPPDVGLLMIHAINPYGFAHIRRVNEDNVDLNRNFIDYSKPFPSNEGYAQLADNLAPQKLSFRNSAKDLISLYWFGLLQGKPKLKYAIAGGQYTHPKGIFYGGSSPTWSHRAVTEITESYLSHAGRVVIIDFHTGLGEYGNAVIIVSPKETHEFFKRAKCFWGVREVDFLYPVNGPLKLAFSKMLPGAKVTAASLEFGTLPSRKVLWALRAENWLHHYGANSPDYKEIKNKLLRAFYPDDSEWKRQVWVQGKDTVETTLQKIDTCNR